MWEKCIVTSWCIYFNFLEGSPSSTSPTCSMWKRLAQCGNDWINIFVSTASRFKEWLKNWSIFSNVWDLLINTTVEDRKIYHWKIKIWGIIKINHKFTFFQKWNIILLECSSSWRWSRCKYFVCSRTNNFKLQKNHNEIVSWFF